jgi:hypothetical protein
MQDAGRSAVETLAYPLRHAVSLVHSNAGQMFPLCQIAELASPVEQLLGSDIYHLIFPLSRLILHTTAQQSTAKASRQ